MDQMVQGLQNQVTEPRNAFDLESARTGHPRKGRSSGRWSGEGLKEDSKVSQSGCLGAKPWQEKLVCVCVCVFTRRG